MDTSPTTAPARRPGPGQQLRSSAAKVERKAADLPERGRVRLLELAQLQRDLAELHDTDPTLADEHPGTGRLRPLDLAAELVRQLNVLVPRACGQGWAVPRGEDPERWAEADILTERAHSFFAEARRMARADHASPEISQAISRARLQAAAADLTQAGQQVRRLLEDALALPHPCPEAMDLAAAAAGLIDRAQALHHAEKDPRVTWELPRFGY